ncbi:hypothetical protein ScPMuIL_009169 [Solemya velum]
MESLAREQSVNTCVHQSGVSVSAHMDNPDLTVSVSHTATGTTNSETANTIKHPVNTHEKTKRCHVFRQAQTEKQRAKENEGPESSARASSLFEPCTCTSSPESTSTPRSTVEQHIKKPVRLSTCNIECFPSHAKYLEIVLNQNDLVALQEHWLYSFQQKQLMEFCAEHCFEAIIHSSDDGDPLLPILLPRGKGGTALLWRKNLNTYRSFTRWKRPYMCLSIEIYESAAELETELDILAFILDKSAKEAAPSLPRRKPRRIWSPVITNAYKAMEESHAKWKCSKTPKDTDNLLWLDVKTSKRLLRSAQRIGAARASNLTECYTRRLQDWNYYTDLQETWKTNKYPRLVSSYNSHQLVVATLTAVGPSSRIFLAHAKPVELTQFVPSGENIV